MLINKIKQKLSSKYIRNVGWLGGAELVNRIFRLATTVTLARTFSTQDYGLMAVVYTTFECANTFTLRGGMGAKIVQADEEDVSTICNTTYWLNWILCGSLCILFCLASFPVAHFYKNPQLVLPLCTVASIFLMFPTFMVQNALIERENRLKITALATATQSIVSNLITVTLAVMGMGVWAIVWGMVLSIPILTIVYTKNYSWKIPRKFQLEGWREITSFGGNILGVELLDVLRWNVDYMIIGHFLGSQTLGIYYFAFNAGLGISMNVLNTFISALFPYLCEVRGNIQELKSRFFGSLKKTATVVVPIVLCQSALAPFYIPIIFGQKWIDARYFVVLLCLSAIPLILSRCSYILLNAIDKPRINLYLQLFYTVVFAIAVLIAVRGGIFSVMLTVLGFNYLMLVSGSVWSMKYVFSQTSGLANGLTEVPKILK